jgi:hypothetical protein
MNIPKNNDLGYESWDALLDSLVKYNPDMYGESRHNSKRTLQSIYHSHWGYDYDNGIRVWFLIFYRQDAVDIDILCVEKYGKDAPFMILEESTELYDHDIKVPTKLNFPTKERNGKTYYFEFNYIDNSQIIIEYPPTYGNSGDVLNFIKINLK